MAARRSRKQTELCAEHFPHGLADQPKDATQVSCEHGAWDIEQPKEPAPPVKKADNGSDGEGDASGEGDTGGQGDGGEPDSDTSSEGS